MKLIVICGSDRLGKSTLIKNLCEYYDYKNLTIRHCDKPPKNLTSEESLDFQFNCFNKEAGLIQYFGYLSSDNYIYHNNIIIYDRFYLGEFVYGQMFRNADPKEIKEKILSWEKYNLSFIYSEFQIYLITLYSEPSFSLSKEDGKSFSKTLEEKTKELELFKEAHEFSTIKNKLYLKVDYNGKFRSEKEIFQDVLDFIK